MVILESMYFGVPVISSLTAGSQMLIKNEINGLVINDMDPSIWTQKITSLYKSRGLNKMGTLAKEEIDSSFTWEKTVSHFISLYNKNDYEDYCC